MKKAVAIRHLYKPPCKQIGCNQCAARYLRSCDITDSLVRKRIIQKLRGHTIGRDFKTAQHVQVLLVRFEQESVRELSYKLKKNQTNGSNNSCNGN